MATAPRAPKQSSIQTVQKNYGHRVTVRFSAPMISAEISRSSRASLSVLTFVQPPVIASANARRSPTNWSLPCVSWISWLAKPETGGALDQKVNRARLEASGAQFLQV